MGKTRGDPQEEGKQDGQYTDEGSEQPGSMEMNRNGLI